MTAAKSGASRRASLRRVIRVGAVCVAAWLLYERWAPRPRSWQLASSVYGPAPAHAAGAIFFLHGRGGGLWRARWIVSALRAAGLPPDVAVVLVEAPFVTWSGHSWGDSEAEQSESRLRVRALLRDFLGERGPPPPRIVLAGFSQGAGLAADVAAEETRVGAMASFSPCGLWLRHELARRARLRVLLAHGTLDPDCLVDESRSLANVLAAAKLPVQYLEFDGGHRVPPEVVRALVSFAATAPSSP